MYYQAMHTYWMHVHIKKFFSFFLVFCCSFLFTVKDDGICSKLSWFFASSNRSHTKHFIYVYIVCTIETRTHRVCAHLIWFSFFFIILFFFYLYIELDFVFVNNVIRIRRLVFFSFVASFPFQYMKMVDSIFDFGYALGIRIITFKLIHNEMGCFQFYFSFLFF